MNLKTFLENFLVVQTLYGSSEGLPLIVKKAIRKFVIKGEEEIKGHSEMLQELVKEQGLKLPEHSPLLYPTVEIDDEKKQKIFISGKMKKEEDQNELEKEIIAEYQPKAEAISEEVEKALEEEIKGLPEVTIDDEHLEKIIIREKLKDKDGNEYDNKRELSGFELTALINLGFVKE